MIISALVRLKALERWWAKNEIHSALGELIRATPTVRPIMPLLTGGWA